MSPEANQSTVHEYAGQLRSYATHFVPRDWDYTGDLGSLYAIQTGPPRAELGRRIRAAMGYLFGGVSQFGPKIGVTRWSMARHSLRVDRHLPDGVLDGGSVIAYWEETGEYLQYVQPTVGALLADLMDAHPGLPEVQAIATEMERIQQRYTERRGQKEKVK